MKRKNNILLISIPLGVLLLLYYGYIALDTWLQFQIRTGNGVSAANSEWIFSIQYTFLFIMKWVDSITCSSRKKEVHPASLPLQLQN